MQESSVNKGPSHFGLLVQEELKYVLKENSWFLEVSHYGESPIPQLHIR